MSIKASFMMEVNIHSEILKKKRSMSKFSLNLTRSSLSTKFGRNLQFPYQTELPHSHFNS